MIVWRQQCTGRILEVRNVDPLSEDMSMTMHNVETCWRQVLTNTTPQSLSDVIIDKAHLRVLSVFNLDTYLLEVQLQP